jgi:hypothetical protein
MKMTDPFDQGLFISQNALLRPLGDHSETMHRSSTGGLGSSRVIRNEYRTFWMTFNKWFGYKWPGIRLSFWISKQIVNALRCSRSAFYLVPRARQMRRTKRDEMIIMDTCHTHLLQLSLRCQCRWKGDLVLCSLSPRDRSTMQLDSSFWVT